MQIVKRLMFMEVGNVKQTLDDVFDVTPIGKQDIVTATGEVIVSNAGIETNVDYDYNITRNNLHSLLSQGQDALIHALQVAKSSEHPRAFEVVGGLMKQLADINHQLIDLSEKKKQFSTKPSTEPDTPRGSTVNNAIFVGSTAELGDVIKSLTGAKQ